MKICVAQTKPVRGDVESNIISHKKLIDVAVANGANHIFFPELSLTGYEPELSKELATTQDDDRFDDFQKISDTKSITIGLGMPLKNESGILISMIIFQPNKQRMVYSKQHLHADEEPYFINGEHQVFLTFDKRKLALAICYELSVPSHSKNAFENGASIYIASVAKTITGVDKAIKYLSEIAKTYSMTVLMSNCIGMSGDGECAGKTSVLNRNGTLVAQLDETNEGIIIIDTDTQEIIEKTLPKE